MPSRVSIALTCGPPPPPHAGAPPQPGQHRADLRTPAVHDHGQDAAGPQEDHVLCERAAALVVDHGVAAVLDHHDVAVELAQPGQRAGEDGDLRRVALRVVLPHDPAGADPLPRRRPLVDGDVGRRGVLRRRGVGARGANVTVSGRDGRLRGDCSVVAHVEYAEFSWTYAMDRSLVQIVACSVPAFRSTSISIWRPVRSTPSRGSPIAPPRQTVTPLMVTSTRSASNAASVVPIAASTPPPVGALPKSPVFSRLWGAQPRPAVSASSTLAALRTVIAMSLVDPSASASSCMARSVHAA